MSLETLLLGDGEFGFLLECYDGEHRTGDDRSRTSGSTAFFSTGNNSINTTACLRLFILLIRSADHTFSLGVRQQH
jgi:hypothetical protein